MHSSLRKVLRQWSLWHQHILSTIWRATQETVVSAAFLQTVASPLLANGVHVHVPCTIPHEWLVQSKISIQNETEEATYPPGNHCPIHSLWPAHCTHTPAKSKIPSPGRRSYPFMSPQMSSTASGWNLSLQPTCPSNGPRMHSA